MVTRAYRPPEVIILEKKYRNSVDIWSAGCVIAEVIKQQIEYKEAGISKKGAFFFGTHCEPLSPKNYNGPDSQDQMEAILKILGPLD